MKRIHSAAVASTASNKSFAIDTTFVLFFLAVEFGRSLNTLTSDVALLGVMLGMIMVVPFFFSSETDRSDFTRWLGGRSLIALLGVVLGVVFRQAMGAVIPDEFGYLPMTLLIATAMVSCYIQFYGLLKFRPAK